MSFVYLASPYSHPDPEIRESRYRKACAKAAALMNSGVAVFSPIAHSHPISEHLAPELVMSFDFWMGQDLPVLRYSKELVVLRLDGWQESRGVAKEIQFARALDIPVRYEDE